VLFSNNPFWRAETKGSYFLVFNAIMNFDSLGAGRKLADKSITPARSGRCATPDCPGVPRAPPPPPRPPAHSAYSASGCNRGSSAHARSRRRAGLDLLRHILQVGKLRVSRLLGIHGEAAAMQAHQGLGAMEDQAAAFQVTHQAAIEVHQEVAGIMERGVDRVGPLKFRNHVVAAHGLRIDGGVARHAPVRHVHPVQEQIGERAAAEIPEPAPVRGSVRRRTADRARSPGTSSNRVSRRRWAWRVSRPCR
jgi:hypothetical protein